MSKDDSRRILKVLVDTREQNPYSFTGYDCGVTRETLETGDISLTGMEDRIALERKSLPDLLQSISGERARFEKEIRRGRHMDVFVVLIEANMHDVCDGKYRSQMSPAAAIQTVISWQTKYRVPFVWCGSRAGAEYFAYWTLQKYIADIEKRLRQATKSQRAKKGQ